jgi:hypothetical protein
MEPLLVGAPQSCRHGLAPSLKLLKATLKSKRIEMTSVIVYLTSRVTQKFGIVGVTQVSLGSPIRQNA